MAPQREWFEKDYYKVLGVSEYGDAKEITKAYRKLARQFHPDANPGDAKAEERFKEISAAYDVARRRGQAQGVRRGPPARPDGRRLRRPGGAGGPGRAASHFDDGDVGDLLGNLFGAAVGRGGGGAGGAGPRRGAATSRPSCTLSFDDAVHGVTTTLHLTSRRRVLAPATAVGRPAGHQRRTCARPAAAAASSTTTRACSRSASPAPTCGGRGMVDRRPVPRPAGAPASSGGPREVKVRIPAGVDDGQRIRLQGPGRARSQRRSGRRSVRRRAGCSPTSCSAATATTSRRGAGHLRRGGARAPTSGAHARRRHRSRCGIQPGTQSGGTQRVKGRGVPTPRSARATCSSPSTSPCPTELSDAERKAIEALRRRRPTSPRRAYLEV